MSPVHVPAGALEVPAKTDPAIPGPPRARIRIDVAALKRRLRSAVSGEVRFDPGTLAMYASDASNYRQVPIGVVVPKTLDDVGAALRVCHEFGAPVLNRGGGTSLSGETVNYAVVIDHSRYLTGIGEIDAERRLVTCEPGVINEEPNRHTGEHGLVFGPDPSTHSRCVIGGNIGNNSCGVHSVYGHFGQGCIHCRLSFDLRTAAGIANYRAFLEEAANLVISYGGSLSGEHGDGQQRAELLEKQYGPDLVQAMREFKRVWDPDWKMNPGKVVDPYRLDEDLKLGTDYNPPRPATKFAYPEDKGDFAHATLRCVGIGKCRDPHGSPTMCPSYQVTREEKHSTRGRARLLFEMLQGEVITDGWRSEEVFDALDLCLACKGCTSDCPVGVDMPSYKSEVLYHHYQSPGRRRPRYAYAFGYIDKAARLASLAPELVNFATQTPGLRRLAKLAAGIDKRRPLPKFAPMTLQQWFRQRGGTTNPSGRPVVLFPDTFNNHLHADVGVACVQALEAAGWRVIMPDGHVCCGRPLYDYGFLDSAQRYLRRVLDELRPYVREDVPVVGMEPSCLAVFKDELHRMLPHDDDAMRLARNCYHFGEFFTAFDVTPPRLKGDALLWGHCHHRATGGLSPEQEFLEKAGLTVRGVKGGCCGLAGSWGFEKGKYAMSMDCGEQALLPAVRGAPEDTLIVADGFSCQTQIADARTGKRALHTAQALAMAGNRDQRAGVPGPPAPPAGRRAVRAVAAALPAAAGLAVAAAVVARAVREAVSR